MPKTTAAAMPRTFMPQSNQKRSVSAHSGDLREGRDVRGWDEDAGALRGMFCGRETCGVDMI